jgi:hypothetical protein
VSRFRCPGNDDWNMGGLVAGQVEDRSGDSKRPGVEVDVAPLEGTEFSAPGAGEGGEHDQGGEDRVALFGQLDDGPYLKRR